MRANTDTYRHTDVQTGNIQTSDANVDEVKIKLEMSV